MRTYDEFQAAIGTIIRPEALDELAKQVWAGLARATFTETDADTLLNAIQSRRVLLKAGRATPAIKARPHAQRRLSSASIGRRRGWVASGALPPQVASHFTTAECAALAVIGRAIQKAGVCDWPIDKIAAIAGCSRTSVQNALREAKRLGFISVQERRHRGRSSETNLVKVISQEWLVWLRLGKPTVEGGSGFRNLNSTNNRLYCSIKIKASKKKYPEDIPIYGSKRQT